MTLTCVAAHAAESGATSGLQKFSIETNYRDFVELVPLDANGRTVVADTTDDTMYPGAAKVGVTYKNPQKDSEYLLIVLVDGDDTTPTVDNMAYIDQKTAGTSDLDFTIYTKKPDATKNSVKYSVYMSSSSDASTGNGVTGYVKVGSFEYYSTGLNVKLGDVDDDGDIMVADAVLVLRAVVEDIVFDERQTAAGDVDKDGDIMVADAVYILRYVVEDITSFDNLNAQ